KTLNQAYEATWRRLQEGQDKRDFELASQVLAWISHAPRPMTQTELQHALVISEGTHTVNAEDERPIDWVITICVGFIVYNGKSIRILHATAKGFLTQRFDNNVVRLREMAWACIDYLAASRFQTPPCKNDDELNSRLEPISSWNCEVKAECKGGGCESSRDGHEIA
ncbi:hypothetical protein C8A03DRAFT_19568, partial [Achaetomium macrosporum]